SQSRSRGSLSHASIAGTVSPVSQLLHALWRRSMSVRSVLIAAVLVFSAVPAAAQEPIPYGNPITLEQARKLIAAAEEEAKKPKWPVAIAIVDPSGHLVAFAKMDNTQLGSIEVAIEKAKSAALFRRATKVFEDALAMGGANLRVLKVPGAIPVEGGV